jgi:osmotically inducible protein OsmC
MNSIVRVLHTARTATTGGREQGAARSCDGLLDIRLAVPGSTRMGANPEQLFAVAWSASFESAIMLAARQRKVDLPAAVAIDAEVDLCVAGEGYLLRARLHVALPGLERQVARALVNEAQRACAYCRATHGNIDVSVGLV